MIDDMSHAQGDRCIGLLLAGGLGRRFRASLPANAAPEKERIDAGSKLLALLPDGRPVVAAAALALYEAVGEVWAVIPVGADRLRRLLEDIGCRVIEAPETTQGMGASIAAGVRHLLADAAACDATALMLTLGDMPWLSPDTLKGLRAQAGQHAVVAPVFDGQRGHPVTFARTLWPALARLAGDTGARSVVQAHGAHVWVTDDPGVIRDVDLYTDLAPEAGPPAA